MCSTVIILTLVQTPLVLIILISPNKIKRTHRASFYTMLKITFIQKLANCRGNRQLSTIILDKKMGRYLCNVTLGD